MFGGPVRYGVPTVIGARVEAESGETLVGISFEWPEDYAQLPGDNAEQKRRNEQRQIDRLRADFRFGGKLDPFLIASQVEQGQDPPDFVCKLRASAAETPVELTQLTFGDRIREQDAFERLKNLVMTRGRGRLGHLRGQAVSVGFWDWDNDRGQMMPLRERDAGVLLDALERFVPVPPEKRPSHFPRSLEGENFVQHFPGGYLQSTPLVGDPPGRYYRLMRSELLLASSYWIQQADAWTRFREDVARKDRAANDSGIVVFIAGSPTWSGNRSRPGDSVLARAIVEIAQSQPAPVTEHLEQIWIHTWPERAVYELRPGHTGATRLRGTPFG